MQAVRRWRQPRRSASVLDGGEGRNERHLRAIPVEIALCGQ
jgi:hypothetical protein